MAVTTQESTEYSNALSSTPPTLNSTAEVHGRVRIAFFTHNQSGAGDATSSVAVCKLPPGRVRLLMTGSGAYVNWTTASATLDLGWDAYTDLAGDTVAADVDGLINGLDVDTVGYQEFGVGTLSATGGTKVFESKGGVVIRASSTDTAIADDDDLVGVLYYVID